MTHSVVKGRIVINVSLDELPEDISMAAVGS
jgi:hypothetical protein